MNYLSWESSHLLNFPLEPRPATAWNPNYWMEIWANLNLSTSLHDKIMQWGLFIRFLIICCLFLTWRLEYFCQLCDLFSHFDSLKVRECGNCKDDDGYALSVSILILDRWQEFRWFRISRCFVILHKLLIWREIFWEHIFYSFIHKIDGTWSKFFLVVIAFLQIILCSIYIPKFYHVNVLLGRIILSIIRKPLETFT